MRSFRSQQARIDGIVTELQPLIAELRKELVAEEGVLASVRPESDDFLIRAGLCGSRIGVLSTQIALAKSKLRYDVHAALSVEQ